MTTKDLWTEKYRPKSVENYVFSDDNFKKQVKSWIEEKNISHILLSGGQGIGKTTLAKLILREFDVSKNDILEINGSDTNGVDVIRDNISSFIGQMPYGEFRYVLIDEADYLTVNAQAILRGYMEKYAATSRFIMTCNYSHKIIPPLKSRMQEFHLEKLDRGEFDIRVATILTSESIQFDVETLDTFVAATYPDLRKCINMLQQNSKYGTLAMPKEADNSSADYRLEMVKLFKERKITQARELVCKKARVEEFEDIFRFLYQNLEFYGSEHNKEEAILVIRKGLVNHAICADAEINLAATMVELSRIMA